MKRIISVIVLYAGLASMVESIRKIIHPVTPDYSAAGLVIVAAAVLDRFPHHCDVQTIRGESYRVREARREGVLGVAGTPDDSGTGT